MERMFHDVLITTREWTPEGYLKAGAVITRQGPFEYKAQELPSSLSTAGMGPIVTVQRTRDTVGHSQTLATIQRAPITLGHPSDDVTAGSWRNVAVGTVLGSPSIDDEGYVRADILITDKDAARAVDQGIDQLSVGYKHGIVRTDEGFATSGPMSVNHIAIVPKGRAGEQVRIQDEGGGEEIMNEEQLKAFRDATATDVATAVMQAMDSNGKKGADSADLAAIVAKAVQEAMDPAVTQLDSMVDEAAERRQEEAQAEAEVKLLDAADRLIAATRAEERARFAVIQDAKPLLDRKGLTDVSAMDTKAILVEALKDVMPDAETRTEEYLTGVLAGFVKQADASPAGGRPLPEQSGYSPAPAQQFVNPFTGDVPKGVVLRDAHAGTSPRDQFVKDMQNDFMKGLDSSFVVE